MPAGALELSYLPNVDDVVAAITTIAQGRIPAPRWHGWRAVASPDRRNDATNATTRRAALADHLARYERIAEKRAFEDAVDDLFTKGEVLGATHTCQGQEAIAVGIAAATRPSDTVTCTYRGHGIALALGGDPSALLAEILGRRAGAAGGRGGSMHLVAAGVGLLPTFAIVGAGLPVAVGAALASQVRGDGRVAIAVFGDGASNIGAFHESLNLASVWGLPVVCVCENNLYGEYSPLARTTSVADIAMRAAAYQMPSAIVDGMDVEIVCDAVLNAVDRARRGEGPTLLEMKTYRFGGHSRGDPAKYRSPDEVARWRERDPVTVALQRLHQSGVPTEAIERARTNAVACVTRAVANALSSPRPEPGDMFTSVWARR